MHEIEYGPKQEKGFKGLDLAYATPEDELRHIQELRAEYGLSPLKPGLVKCLRCDKMFESWDVRHNRICPECRLSNQDYDVVDMDFARLDDVISDLDYMSATVSEMDLIEICEPFTQEEAQ